MPRKKSGQPPNFIPPDKTLKIKAGDGGIAAHLLFRAQRHIDTNTENFKPYADQNLAQLMDLLKSSIAATDHGVPQVIQGLIMQLKGNGSMFGYQLVSRIAEIILHLIEKKPPFDENVRNIIRIHNNILAVILRKNFKGAGGKHGELLAKELESACKRYCKKQGIKWD